jgi:signal transduction histidine kinase
MTYRTFKRLLGETSLERKCRFLFGSGLLLLITGSFYLYGRLTARLVADEVVNRNVTAGRHVAMLKLTELHWKYFEQNAEFQKLIDQFHKEMQSFLSDMQTVESGAYQMSLIKPDLSDPLKRPAEADEYDALRVLLDKSRNEVYRERLAGEFRYYGALRAKGMCIKCHQTAGKAYAPPSETNPALHEGDLLGIVKVTWPLQKIDRSLALNNAILLATAIGTAFLAMTAAYAIVRYVVVKPVQHLKTVSDAISRGHLDRRAEIRTGDEFEQLSHAFNRMLRHLLQLQEELHAVNSQLDGKVDQLAQANMRLYELNNLKNDFLATMTHELRTPLNSILGFSEVLLGTDNLSDKQQRWLKNIQQSGRDLLTLVNDILDLAKIESGKMDLHVTEFAIGDLIERMASMVRPLAEKRNIDLRTHADAALPLVRQDMGKIQQILYNLVSNAIKFTPEGGRVWVEARIFDPYRFRIVVGDTGVGIPMEDQETIFERFRQGNTVPGRRTEALTREYAGTGLGLSIVKELSKLLGGEVSLVSELGKGSVFTVELPCVLTVTPKSLDQVLAAAAQTELEAVARLRPEVPGLLPPPGSPVSTPA